MTHLIDSFTFSGAAGAATYLNQQYQYQIEVKAIGAITGKAYTFTFRARHPYPYCSATWTGVATVGWRVTERGSGTIAGDNHAQIMICHTEDGTYAVSNWLDVANGLTVSGGLTWREPAQVGAGGGY